MKFFSKYKKQIFSVFLCVALFSCFVGFSFSSSADVQNIVSPVSADSVFFEYNSNYAGQFGYSLHFSHDGSGYRMNTDLGISTPSAVFQNLVIRFPSNYTVPAYSGRELSLSFNVDFLVSETGYLSYIPDNVDISDSAIFTDCFLRLYFDDGSRVDLFYDTFTLKDDDLGVVVDSRSDSYWNSIKGNIMDLSIYALFDVTAYSQRTIMDCYLIFPDGYGDIYYSNDDLNNYLYIQDIVATLDFAYMPFNDVVQEDLTGIKGSLSGVNNKLDSLNSTMNTIDQDINRVNQKFDQTNETLGDIDQGIQDILKPSTPAVDFKNQWNDYFINNNPIPDMSTLPFYDMSAIQTLLIDSSDIIRSIFSPFFLRDYVVRVPLTQGFANVEVDPMATYVSLSFALTISFIMFRLLKGRRG